jgi:hypothetical protein
VGAGEELRKSVNDVVLCLAWSIVNSKLQQDDGVMARANRASGNTVSEASNSNNIDGSNTAFATHPHSEVWSISA